MGVFNVKGAFYAMRNLCPHRGAPLCRGSVHGIERSDAAGPVPVSFTREGEFLRCPWHHREFDIGTGRALFDPDLAVQTYRVVIEGDDVVLLLDAD